MTPALRAARIVLRGGLVAGEVVVDDRLALRGRQQARPQADQAAGRDAELQVGDAAALVHLLQRAATQADHLHDGAHVGFGHVDDEVLDWLHQRAVFAALQHDFRLADRQLVPLASHGLDEDAQVHQPATLDAHRVVVGRVLDLQGDVALQLFVQPIANLAARDVVAVLADERAVVDAEGHRQRRRLDLQRRHR